MSEVTSEVECSRHIGAVPTGTQRQCQQAHRTVPTRTQGQCQQAHRTVPTGTQGQCQQAHRESASRYTGTVQAVKQGQCQQAHRDSASRYTGTVQAGTPGATHSSYDCKGYSVLIRYVLRFCPTTQQLKKKIRRCNLSGRRLSNWFKAISFTRDEYRRADKSLVRPGRKQARKHVRDARDFNNNETRAATQFFFPARQGAEGNSRNFDRNISLFPSWSG